MPANAAYSKARANPAGSLNLGIFDEKRQCVNAQRDAGVTLFLASTPGYPLSMSGSIRCGVPLMWAATELVRARFAARASPTPPLTSYDLPASSLFRVGVHDPLALSHGALPLTRLDIDLTLPAAVDAHGFTTQVGQPQLSCRTLHLVGSPRPQLILRGRPAATTDETNHRNKRPQSVSHASEATGLREW